jgi:hypothetical protein
VIIVGKSNKRKYFFSSNPFSSFKRITLWNHPGITSLPLKREPGSCSGSSAKQALEKGTCIISIVRCHQIVVDLLKLQIYVASVQKKRCFFYQRKLSAKKKDHVCASKKYSCLSTSHRTYQLVIILSFICQQSNQEDDEMTSTEASQCKFGLSQCI